MRKKSKVKDSKTTAKKKKMKRVVDSKLRKLSGGVRHRGWTCNVAPCVPCRNWT